jgi:hypothetical protein
MTTRSDLRARLTLKSLRGGAYGLPNSITSRTTGDYDLPLLGPGEALRRTNGIVFPFTPNINVSHQVEYSQYDLVHTNYQQNAYGKTRNPAIQVTGMFASQTPEEASYTVGVMHFLRVASKMNFGSKDPDAGTPPPVLDFTAYGPFNFNKVPVLLGSFNFIYEDNTDYVEVGVLGQRIQIPTIMTIAMDLLPQYSPARQMDFNLNDFARGALYTRGFI